MLCGFCKVDQGKPGCFYLGLLECSFWTKSTATKKKKKKKSPTLPYHKKAQASYVEQLGGERGAWPILSYSSHPAPPTRHVSQEAILEVQLNMVFGSLDGFGSSQQLTLTA
jgi:hypothetical protein